MTVLVTGAGVIGSHTARILAERGESVVLMDLEPALESIGSIVESDKVSIVQGDIVDYDRLRTLVSERGIDAIVHTAAMLSRAIRGQPRHGVMVNVLGVTNMLEIAREQNLRRVVLASSGTVGYPTFDSFRGETFPEDFSMRVLSERPNTLYSVTKLAGEHIALFYQQEYGTDAVILRYGAVLSAWRGETKNTPGKMLADLLGPAIAGKAAVIDDPMTVWGGNEEFVDARDCAAGNVAALFAEDPKNRVYNLSCGQAHTYMQIVDAVRELYPSLKVDIQVPLEGGMAGLTVERPAPSDISLARSELGYAPAYTLQESIQHFATVMSGS